MSAYTIKQRIASIATDLDEVMLSRLATALQADFNLLCGRMHKVILEELEKASNERENLANALAEMHVPREKVVKIMRGTSCPPPNSVVARKNGHGARRFRLIQGGG